LKWNQGNNNFVDLCDGRRPGGAYDSTRLSDLGIGYGAIDAGGGYTYLDMQTRREFSTVAGDTYNFLNLTPNNQNGVDFHLVSESESEWLYFIVDTLRKGKANLLMRSCTEAM
jgi:hypothetical protein